MVRVSDFTPPPGETRAMVGYHAGVMYVAPLGTECLPPAEPWTRVGGASVRWDRDEELRRATRTTRVLEDVAAHRREQDARYGEVNKTLVDGTGPEVQWLLPLSFTRASVVEKMLRGEYDSHERPTWMHLVREEVAEAFQESDPVRLREELIQVAALCVSWVEQIDAR
jgi:hypothetical protein